MSVIYGKSRFNCCVNKVAKLILLSHISQDWLFSQSHVLCVVNHSHILCINIKLLFNYFKYKYALFLENQMSLLNKF
jgi:hypothetical protein